MYFVGLIAVWGGIALIAAGMVVGFGAMIMQADEFWMRWIAFVPWGFLILLTGTVITQLTGRRRRQDSSQ